jgi:hypothetical protein
MLKVIATQFHILEIQVSQFCPENVRLFVILHSEQREFTGSCLL